MKGRNFLLRNIKGPKFKYNLLPVLLKRDTRRLGQVKSQSTLI